MEEEDAEESDDDNFPVLTVSVPPDHLPHATTSLLTMGLIAHNTFLQQNGNFEILMNLHILSNFLFPNIK